jgi:hypothetical protein
MSLTSSLQTPSSPRLRKAFRPPAVPLVTHTPYFSVWSTSDNLTDTWTTHWTGSHMDLCGMLRIDGATYRFSGCMPKEVPAMEQRSVEVHPTRTVYTFLAAGIQLTVEFLSPLLADDLELLARPVTYITLTARSIDGQGHEVEACLDVNAQWVVDKAEQPVFASRHRIQGLETMALRSVDQKVLGRPGDDLRIDWGTLYLSVPTHPALQSTVGPQKSIRNGFAKDGCLPATDDMRFPRSGSDEWPILAVVIPMGLVGADEVNRVAMLAYDEEFAVEYFHRKLPPYWKRSGDTAAELLTAAHRDYRSVRQRCAEFDETLWNQLKEVGGYEYAAIASLSYRQCLAAHCIVQDLDGTLLMFSKENFSNGCIGTVDVTYPGAPFFLHFNLDLLKAQIVPVLDYAGTPRWKFPFAPHDLGTYPLANGQVYGGGERTEDDQMPVEECGNMLLLVAAVCEKEGSADFAGRYWPVLTQWADYLLQCGMDPENQLCTDDFAGHMAHNANLSLKAILALGAYADLCRLRGEELRSKLIRETAERMADQWMRVADDGDHYRLAFDKPGSWSQKYNLVWDRLLRLNLFPDELARKEVAYYLTRQNAYGLPLDSRKEYTKLDWIVWTATLAESNEDFRALVRPLLTFADESTSRVPLTDWYCTSTAKQMHFQARSVVGGVFIPLLKPI